MRIWCGACHTRLSILNKYRYEIECSGNLVGETSSVPEWSHRITTIEPRFETRNSYIPLHHSLLYKSAHLGMYRMYATAQYRNSACSSNIQAFIIHRPCNAFPCMCNHSETRRKKHSHTFIMRHINSKWTPRHLVPYHQKVEEAAPALEDVSRSRYWISVSVVRNIPPRRIRFLFLYLRV